MHANNMIWTVQMLLDYENLAAGTCQRLACRIWGGLAGQQQGLESKLQHAAERLQLLGISLELLH